MLVGALKSFAVSLALVLMSGMEAAVFPLSVKQA
jgi:hypothetical protein